ncbi:MAG TPA: TOBE domain-containing protein, partial [Candidatus Binatia bacterium]|nr:TOBE domain-containing protein [Candidatus Binatia bacterium]
PPMNLLPARVGDGPALLIGRGTVPLPDAPADVADGWTVGLRPEALDVVPATDARGAVPARIAHLESLGYETLAHLRLEGDDDARLVARLVGMPALAPGQPVGLVVDPAQVRLFDRDGRLVR